MTIFNVSFDKKYKFSVTFTEFENLEIYKKVLKTTMAIKTLSHLGICINFTSFIDIIIFHLNK